MKFQYFSLQVLVALLFATGAFCKVEKDVTKLQIGVKLRPEKCERKAHNGDKVKVHYKGMLTDGTVFDSSLERGDPIDFVLGAGNVIKGWDLGLLGMCIGEKRKLKIPADMGYGENGSPPKIPGGATLIFETELMDISDGAPEFEDVPDMDDADLDDDAEMPEDFSIPEE